MVNAGYVGNRDKALEAYRQSKVETASPAELVLMLYNGCLKYMRNAVQCIKSKDYSGANESLIHAQDIIDELRVSLDFSMGEIADSLASVYDFVYSSLVSANLKKDAEQIQDTITVMTEIRDGWEEAIRSHG
ncbi:MAG: flagellar export chaperone FliS [Firmicutes bacterium]|nr:flagellar export chaperone FliS [Candidatus Fermentithermobacillaceae bacterium]